MTTTPVEELLEYLRSTGRTKKVRKGPAHSYADMHRERDIQHSYTCRHAQRERETFRHMLSSGFIAV